MRLCRVKRSDREFAAFYSEDYLIPLAAAAEAFANATHETLRLPAEGDLLPLLPPDGAAYAAAARLADWLAQSAAQVPASARIATAEAQLLVPLPRPNKLFLLAGNYAAHIQEGGGVAAERAETFPYVFMKPPTTTLVDPGAAVRIPEISPRAIDWELELAVVIGRRCKGVAEKDALSYVAGYTIINDISDRKFRPNPGRKPREKDAFFDWLHGKWHDGFCPCGPCVTTADAIADPQQLTMSLQVNGTVKQQATTGQMIFPVAAVIEFLASFVTLEPGDIISTGTPAGVGNATGTYLGAGDIMLASIEGIGTLATPVQ